MSVLPENGSVLPEIITKRCIKCEELLPLSRFSIRVDRNSYKSSCRACISSYEKKRIK